MSEHGRKKPLRPGTPEGDAAPPPPPPPPEVPAGPALPGAEPPVSPADDAPARPARRSTRHAKTEDTRIRKFAIEAARLLADSHCENVLILDVRGLSNISDYLVIASGTSERQIHAVGEDVEELGQELGIARYGKDADTPATWLVLDFVDVVLHLFDPATRAHYDLEMLWGDAPKVTWRRTTRKAKAEPEE